MDTDRQQAQALLADAERAGSVVGSRVPREHLPLYFWGLFLALLIPGFDFINPAVWGWVVLSVAAVGTIGSFYYFGSRVRQIRWAERVGPWVPAALTAWMSTMGLITVFFGDKVNIAYTIAGILSAIPYLVIAERVRRAA